MDHIKQFEPFFGEWYAESFIGAGSFGRVYRIYKESFGRRFYSALKYISIPADSSETVQHRLNGMDDQSIATYYEAAANVFSEEIELMYRLRGNTNIVSFEDSSILPKKDGVGYDVLIRMELLTNLTERMLNSTLGTDEVLKIGTDICAALEVCKKQGIIHRDIKPENIFVSETGDYKLGDFGIARQLEKTATFMSRKGTYNYMAPEVYKGEKYGASCDIYSLGLVLYRLLNNGRLPFLPPVPQQIMPDDIEAALARRVKGEPLPAPCNADGELAGIVLKACACEPKDRYASAKEMRAALLASSIGKAFDKTAACVAPEVFGTKKEGTQKKPQAVRKAGPSVITGGRSFCKFCGAKLDSGSDFCASCGTKLFGSNVAVRTNDCPHNERTQNNQQDVGTARAKDTVGSNNLQYNEPSKKNRRKIGFAFGIIAAAVFCIVIAIWLKNVLDNTDQNNGLVSCVSNISKYYSNSASVTSTPTPSPTPTPTPSPTLSPTPTLSSTPAPTISSTPNSSSVQSHAPSDVYVGGIITFGCYEQDNNLGNGSEPIEWIVLAKTDNSALIISRYALDCMAYHSLEDTATWETSSVREWLNSSTPSDSFLFSAFFESERSRILTTTNTNPGNPFFDLPAESNTHDRVFLLSIDEVNLYFDNSADSRICYATAYAIAQGVKTESNDNNQCAWILRSRGYYDYSATCITWYGSFSDYTDLYLGHAIRPAMWISLE